MGPTVMKKEEKEQNLFNIQIRQPSHLSVGEKQSKDEDYNLRQRFDRSRLN